MGLADDLSKAVRTLRRGAVSVRARRAARPAQK